MRLQNSSVNKLHETLRISFVTDLMIFRQSNSKITQGRIVLLAFLRVGFVEGKLLCVSK